MSEKPIKAFDLELGMKCSITRRDILHGIGGLSAAALLPGCSINDLIPDGRHPPDDDSSYPPSLTGLRGNHKGSFEVSHQLGREGRREWGHVEEAEAELYDLVVVGGGISGLSAAHFYQKNNPNARILILDNHDDFGGHAKRNEFQIGGRRLIGYGGSQTLAEPGGYSNIVKGLLNDLEIDPKFFENAYDQDFYKRNGLKAGLHFDREKWGSDHIVRYDWGMFTNYIPLAPSTLSAQEAVSQMPISDAAKTELLSILLAEEDQIPEIPADAKTRYLSRISYRDFLSHKLNITEDEVFEVLQDLTSDSGVGIESTSAQFAIEYSGLPGRAAAGMPPAHEAEPYIHHFPDGNASVARALVQKLIPSVADAKTMVDRLTARFDYSKLDQASEAVRLRLNSTAVKIEHDGDTMTAREVYVTYVKDKKTFRVKAGNCILACNNSAIPYLCPQLPAEQREALSFQVKTPILYTSVALRNWRAWKNLGIGAVYSPGAYHVHSALDFPVSFGDYDYANNPDDPVIVHMERFPHKPYQGLTGRQQFKLGRHELISTSFATIERNIRHQLTSMLGAGGFDPAKDIQGITVNRWAHGYASWYNPLFDTVYEDENDERYPHMRGRKRFGRIAIANSDAAASAMMEAAVEEGYRAVTELV
ncbi:MAG: FAD-dependent oxidoreductase [Gammaproteobacteria bacterium]|nr:FAD-dependent oxidoreductase [Gammaproteobacteria bacterium]